MLIIRVIAIVFLILAGNHAFGQTPAKTPEKPPVNQPSAEQAETVEEVDGIWELTGYLGKKLMTEMGNRMNLDESESQEKARTKRVKIKIGPFKIERVESI